MKRFNFKPEKILKLRRYREEETEIALGRAVSALTAIERRMEVIGRDRLRAAEERFAPGNGTAEIRSYEWYIRRLDLAMEKLLVEAAQAELAVEEARTEFIEASRDRKVLDKLRERRLKEHGKLLLAEETGILDEIAGSAVARKLADGGA
jgi:flagellar FliJ protein